MANITITPEIEEAYESGKREAEQILNDPDKMEVFLQRLEQKLDEVPLVGEQLSMVPVMISMIKSYVKGEYRECPVSTIVAMIASLLYLISPKDIIKDSIPVLGLLDDIAVIYLSWKYVIGDVDAYQKWRAEAGRETVFFNESEEEKAKKEAEIARTQKIRDTVNDKVDVVKSVVEDKTKGLGSKIKEKTKDLGSTVKEKTENVKSAVKEKAAELKK